MMKEVFLGAGLKHCKQQAMTDPRVAQSRILVQCYPEKYIHT